MHSPTIPQYSTSIFPPKLHIFTPNRRLFSRTILLQQRMASFSRIGVSSEVGGVRSSSGGDDGVGTLMEFVGKRGVDVGDELVVLFHHIQYACKRIAALVASPFNSTLGKHSGLGGGGGAGGSDRDAPKPLDIVSVRLLLHFHVVLQLLFVILVGCLPCFCFS